jgi:hypothetical protein
MWQLSPAYPGLHKQVFSSVHSPYGASQPAMHCLERYCLRPYAQLLAPYTPMYLTTLSVRIFAQTKSSCAYHVVNWGCGMVITMCCWKVRSAKS